MVNIEDILTRLKEHYIISNSSTLVKTISVNKNTISTWQSRNTIPFKILIDISLNEKISLDWLLFGLGKKTQKNSLQNENIVYLTLNIKKYNDEQEIQNIIKLFEYAPKQYLNIIKKELENIKNILNNRDNEAKK